jgi:HK97 gp10 family phage protein
MTKVTVDIQIDGLRPEQINGKVRAAIEKGLMAVALIGQNEAKRLIIKGPKTGRIYERGKTKKGKRKFHQASAPGEPPANDTGFLVSHIFAEPVREGLVGASKAIPGASKNIAARIVARAPYAVHLEFGTRKMEPRPFIRPAGDKAAAQGPVIIKAYMDEAIK